MTNEEIDFKEIMNMHNGSDFNKELREKLQRENRRLKVLWITDDFKEYHIDLQIKRARHWFIDLEIIDVFKYKSGYDVVMIDYGMLGGGSRFDNEEHRRIRVLQDYKATDIKMVWCGALGRGDYYTNAVIQDFPRNKFLHNLPSLGFGDPEVDLHRWLGGIDKW
jgi:hypothetical protein